MVQIIPQLMSNALCIGLLIHVNSVENLEFLIAEKQNTGLTCPAKFS